jgi:hypothetical protein
MDPKYLILSGGAVACIALGYLGLNFSEEEEDIKKVFDKEDTLVGKEEKELKREVEEELKDKKVNLKIEVTKKNTGWGEFWKDQYDSNDNNKISIVDSN